MTINKIISMITEKFELEHFYTSASSCVIDSKGLITRYEDDWSFILDYVDEMKKDTDTWSEVLSCLPKQSGCLHNSNSSHWFTDVLGNNTLNNFKFSRYYALISDVDTTILNNGWVVDADLSYI